MRKQIKKAMSHDYDTHVMRKRNPYWDTRNEIRSKPVKVKEVPSALCVGLTPLQLETLKLILNS